MNPAIADTPATGRCLCGAVSYTFTAEPASVIYCHCQSCRRFSGAPVAGYVGLRASDVSWRGTATRYESALGIFWGSCATCGTSMSYEADWCAGEVHLLMGTLDEPERFPPRSHSFHSERIEWLQLAESLPKDPETLER